jgi:accessory gene regulator B
MIETASVYLAKKLKQMNTDETPPINVMRYSIKFILLNFIILPLLVIGSGFIIGDLKPLLISAAGFIILRFFSGGVHINNAWGCAITSTLAFQLFVFVSMVINNHSVLIWTLSAVSLVLTVVFAPSNIDKQTKFKKENYKWLRIASISIILINILLIRNIWLTSAFFFQALTLIHRFKEVK